jgi:two-component system, OmpR family, phosphate regulon sensor histidine kinase PhoR
MTRSQLVEVEDSELPHSAWEVLEVSDSRSFQAKDRHNDFDSRSRRSRPVNQPWRDLHEENVRLRKAAKLQAELLASVAHDLQTPLSSIIGFTELLLTRDLDPATRRRSLQIIAGEMRRLGRLIDDLFETQPDQQTDFTLSRGLFDLSQLLGERVDLFRAQSDAHELRLGLVLPSLPVRADRERIAQVIDNLLSNAIKYSPEGGAVVVSAASNRGGVRVAVHDNGLGIPAEQQHLVFGRLFRTDRSRASGIKGRGLGLARCREIVQAHGGAIGFDSADGKGSTFWFELPRARW